MVVIIKDMHQNKNVIKNFLKREIALLLKVDFNYFFCRCLFLGGSNKRNRDLTVLINTKPHDNATSHDPRASSLQNAKFVTLEANYFALQSALSNWKIYKYHVTFEPECLMKRLQIFLVSQHKATIGGYLFDGAQLFTTRNLHGENKSVEFRSETRDQTVYAIKAVFTRIVSMSDQESLQVLNLIQRRNMSGLHLQLVGRNYYDPQNMVNHILMPKQCYIYNKSFFYP